MFPSPAEQAIEWLAAAAAGSTQCCVLSPFADTCRRNCPSSASGSSNFLCVGCMVVHVTQGQSGPAKFSVIYPYQPATRPTAHSTRTAPQARLDPHTRARQYRTSRYQVGHPDVACPARTSRRPGQASPPRLAPTACGARSLPGSAPRARCAPVEHAMVCMYSKLHTGILAGAVVE